MVKTVRMPDLRETVTFQVRGISGDVIEPCVFDGSTAVLFLRRIKENIETWDWEQELA